LWCVLGILLSFYTLYVEVRHEKDRNFKALCDVNERISCSKVFMSKYGKGFGLFSKESPFNLPNPVFGIFFYVTQLFVAMFCGRDGRLINFFIIQAIVSNFMSVYLGYILFFVLNDLCVVCVATYVVNALMLQAGISRRTQAMALEDKEKSSNKPD
jgi:vitamin-K-epoxide reductase (warfarin-sensitive)